MITITSLTQAEKLTLARRVQSHIAELAQLGIPSTNGEALEAVLLAIESERTGSVATSAKASVGTAKAVVKQGNGGHNVPSKLTFTCNEVAGATLVVEFKEFQSKNWGYSGKFPTINGVEFNYVNPVVRKAK